MNNIKETDFFDKKFDKKEIEKEINEKYQTIVSIDEINKSYQTIVNTMEEIKIVSKKIEETRKNHIEKLEDIKNSLLSQTATD